MGIYELQPSLNSLQPPIHAIHSRRERRLLPVDPGYLALDMAKPFAELGHIRLNAIDPLIQTGKIGAKRIEDLIGHQTRPVER